MSRDVELDAANLARVTSHYRRAVLQLPSNVFGDEVPGGGRLVFTSRADKRAEGLKQSSAPLPLWGTYRLPSDLLAVS